MDRLLTLIVFLGMCLLVPAQPFMFKHLEVADGLSNNSVYSILKDKDGFVWFGTGGGLNRYDGYSFKVYRHLAADSCSLPTNLVKGIVEAPDDYFWIKLGIGYTLFDKDRGKFINNLAPFMNKLGSKGLPESVFVDSLDNTWISVPGEGYYRYDRDGKVMFLSLYTCGFPDSGVNTISQCADGILFLYDTGKLVCVDSSDMKLRWVKDEISGQTGGRKAAFSLFADNENCIWIFSVYGLWVYDIHAGKWRPDLSGYWEGQADVVHTIAQDNKGRIWIGKDSGGIDVFDKRSGKIINIVNEGDNPRSLSHNTVYHLYADRNGLMWAGTYKKGVSYYGESLFKFNMYELGDITCVEQADEGLLWLGTNDDGLLFWDVAEARIRKHIDFAYPVVSLLRTHDGRLWIGTFNGGLYCMDGKKLLRYTTSDGLLNNSIWTMAEAGGNLWIGYLEGGLQYMNLADGHLNTFVKKPDMVSSLCVTGDGFLVVGSSGIELVDLQSLKSTRILQKEIRPLSDVNQVYCDSRGLIWVATREGLVVYDKKRHKVLDSSEITALQGEIISGVTEDRNHDLWVSSTRRMVHLKVQKDNEGEYMLESHIYNEKDGLQNCDFNLRTIKTMNNGTIVAGGLYGLNVFDPDRISYNKMLPKVMFSGMSLFNEPVEVERLYDHNLILPEELDKVRRIELNFKQNIFTVDLATDNYILPDKTQYQYKLDGMGNEWLSLPIGVNRITFTNLSHGHYILSVRAVNSDGYLGNEIARLDIIVRSPFWMSWWAYLCYAFMAILALLFARRYILKREREKFHIQQVEREAAKNEEVNQMKFRFFTNISHELRTPLTLIISPLEELLAKENDGERKTMLTLMYRNARRLLILVNQLLDFRKGEMSGHQLSLSEGDIVSYIREICNSFLLMADNKHIQFSFFSGVETFPMAFDADKVGKIVMNLLSNAFKYTPDGGRVTVMMDHLEGTDEMIEIKISDTGIGISDEDKKHIFERFYQTDHKGVDVTTGTGIGLSLVRDFVRLHGGRVEVFDNIGAGTVFVVQLPVRHVEASAGLPEQENEPEKIISQPDRNDFPLILIVDDNEDFRSFMQHSLELQYRVKLASNGEEAWDMLPDLLPDLIISDVMMPEMDGIELCRRVKADKRTMHIPVILLTARQAVEEKVKGLEIGADDYVTKPFNMMVLALRIRKLIEQSRYRRTTHAPIEPSPSDIVITSLDEKLIGKAIKYVEDNISRSDLSVEELSRELGMSRVHLYKKLLQITGRTPIEFIRVIRLKRAAQLLRESQLHVSEVAYEVGFNSPKYFSRYFKEEFGVLPSVYQEKEGK